MQSLQKENSTLKTQLGWDGKAPLVVAKPAGKNQAHDWRLYPGQCRVRRGPDARWAGIENRFLLRRAIECVGQFCGEF